jgi:hypothetical protein
VAGVDPYIKDGGRVFLNPAAFTTPAPGQFGNLERNSIHGPDFRQIDMVVSKRFGPGRGSNAELRLEVFNLFNQTNFALPPAVLPNGAAGDGREPDAGEPHSAGRSVHLDSRRIVRAGCQHGFDDDGPRHESSDSAGIPLHLLTFIATQFVDRNARIQGSGRFCLESQRDRFVVHAKNPSNSRHASNTCAIAESDLKSEPNTSLTFPFKQAESVEFLPIADLAPSLPTSPSHAIHNSSDFVAEPCSARGSLQILSLPAVR